MGRIKDRVGEVHGDFVITKRLSKYAYEVKCVHCGLIRDYNISTVLHGKMLCKCNKTYKRICRGCGKEFLGSDKKLFCSHSCCTAFHNKIRKKKETENRKRRITKTTRMLICVYTEEGLSKEEISDILKRPENVVGKILERCRENGEYDKFVFQSPILPILIKRKRKCT